jgi:hypothetical protein
MAWRCLYRDFVGLAFMFGGEKKDDQDVYYLDLDKNQMPCCTTIGLFNFNLTNHRFTYFYPHGFIDGDDVKNTPSVNAGTCTPIQ